MIRKSLLILASVAVVLFQFVALAQDYWNYNVFPYDYEKFVYEVRNYESSWIGIPMRRL